MGAGCSMEKGIHEDVLYKQIKEVNYSDADLLKLISDREKKVSLMTLFIKLMLNLLRKED